MVASEQDRVSYPEAAWLILRGNAASGTTI